MRKIILFSVIQQLLYHLSRVESLIGQNFIRIEDSEFPFIASLQYFPEGHNFCGGALISKKHVITSAHCLEGETRESFRIVFEITNAQELAVSYMAASWTTYVAWADRGGIPYDQYAVHDIAVVELIDRVYHVNPVQLNELTKGQLNGRAAILTGWQNNFLSKSTVNLLNDEDCDRSMHVLNDEPVVDNRTLCTTANNPFALLDNGDSGCPLLHTRDNSLLGVAFGLTPDDSNVNGNFSNEFIRQHQVNVHFSVDRYRSFIRSFIQAAPAA